MTTGQADKSSAPKQEKASIGIKGSLQSLLKPRSGDDWTKLISAIIGVSGLVWGAWEFSFKEILRPASAPVNISLDLKITKPTLPEMQRCDSNCPPLPVTLLAEAKNASNRILTMRKSYWIAHVIAISTKNAANPEAARIRMITDINSKMTPNSASLSIDGESSNYYFSESTEQASGKARLVGFGRLFLQDEIRPGEVIRVQRVILIPPSPQTAYKLARVRIMIPTYNQQADFADEELVRIVGGVYPDEDSVQMYFCEVERNRRRNGPIQWFFDKFMLPVDKSATRRPEFAETATKYCPSFMGKERTRSIGGQVFTTEQEIPLFDLTKESMSTTKAQVQ